MTDTIPAIRRAGGRVLRRGRRVLREATGSVKRGANGIADRANRLANPPDGARALRARLQADGARLNPAVPDRRWEEWINRALHNGDEVASACDELARCGLPEHADRPKNWDLLVALGSILDSVPRRGAVLEMGAPQYARLLPWLFLYGYRDLHGIDIAYDAPVKAGPIRYQHMDLTATTFSDRRFDAIACLSVIEHGVDLDAYLREASRLLRPGGLLITSTDFWCEPVDTGGQVAYGTPIRIFEPADMTAFVDAARGYGLEAARDTDWSCDERVVHWKRFDLDYTFVNVVLRKA